MTYVRKEDPVVNKGFGDVENVFETENAEIFIFILSILKDDLLGN